MEKNKNKNKNIEKAKRYVNQLLSPMEDHYYHEYSHALEVMQRAMYLSQKEWLNDDEIEMMGLAAIFHDTGFIIQYDNNEPIWAKIAENYLKSILYPGDKIKRIEEIILATDPKYLTPKNIYEEIIKDADMDNLWREDFFDKSNKLKKEIETIKHIKINDPEWKHGLVELLTEHKFYTRTQKEERDRKKEVMKHKLEEMIHELENDVI